MGQGQEEVCPHSNWLQHHHWVRQEVASLPPSCCRLWRTTWEPDACCVVTVTAPRSILSCSLYGLMLKLSSAFTECLFSFVSFSFVHVRVFVYVCVCMFRYFSFHYVIEREKRERERRERERHTHTHTHTQNRDTEKHLFSVSVKQLGLQLYVLCV